MKKSTLNCQFLEYQEPPSIGSFAESAFLPVNKIIFLHVYKLQGKIW
jgi:hypothetical protein